ncbi:stage III sporulation protein AF [Paenibacillus sp. HB172176]|uniref:stage III sporulation protein AF n=1 Tax=Paenibacillus sp. HB172176 TaxID=2493690 RepID=UPI0014399B72|nr:stage III sporulation protein AF [Paenibacillus sp. HB172176]
MIAWISDWLRDIVSVILLAVLVELLLPNKTMQRYARLVVGLFILLTLLSPLLRLMQSNIAERLDAGMVLWDKRLSQNGATMPSLEEIQQKAKELRERQDDAAARLMEASLADAMGNEMKKQNLNVQSVRVTLDWEDSKAQAREPYIEGVTVILNAAGAKESDNGMKPVEPVIVDGIRIHVELESGKGATGGPGGDEASQGSEAETEELPQGYAAVADKDATRIQSILTQGWGLSKNRIEIRQQA